MEEGLFLKGTHDMLKLLKVLIKSRIKFYLKHLSIYLGTYIIMLLSTISYKKK